MRDRAWRRRQEGRAKGRSRRTWDLIDAQDGNNSGRSSDPRWVGIRATTRCLPNQQCDRGKLRHQALADISAVEQGVPFANIKKSPS